MTSDVNCAYGLGLDIGPGFEVDSAGTSPEFRAFAAHVDTRPRPRAKRTRGGLSRPPDGSNYRYARRAQGLSTGAMPSADSIARRLALTPEQKRMLAWKLVWCASKCLSTTNPSRRSHTACASSSGVRNPPPFHLSLSLSVSLSLRLCGHQYPGCKSNWRPERAHERWVITSP